MTTSKYFSAFASYQMLINADEKCRQNIMKYLMPRKRSPDDTAFDKNIEQFICTFPHPEMKDEEKKCHPINIVMRFKTGITMNELKSNICAITNIFAIFAIPTKAQFDKIIAQIKYLKHFKLFLRSKTKHDPKRRKSAIRRKLL